MSEGHYAKNQILVTALGAGKVLGASETATVVSREFRISAADSLNFRMAIKVSTVTVAAAVTAKLQHSWNGGTTWAAVGNRAQVAITADGVFEISLVATDTSDAAQLPLYPLARLVCDTGGGDAVTFDEIWVVHRG